MQPNRWRKGWVVLSLFASLALVLLGCGTGEKASGEAKRAGADTALQQLQREVAMQHFIDGSVYEVKGEYAQAALEYQEALRYEKNHAMYYGLAKCYSALNKPALAMEAAKEAVRLAPDKLDYRRLLADIDVSAYDLDDASAQYEEIIKRDSSSIDAWYNLARVYQNRKPPEALEVYEQMTVRFGPQWDVLLQTAELSNKLGQYKRAMDALKQMIEIDPGNKELKSTLAQTEVRAGNLDDALAIFQELRDLDPSNLDYQMETAGIWLLKKDYSRAAAAFNAILDRDTVSVDVKVHIGELYFGQLEKDSTLIPVAHSIFGRIRDKHPNDWRPYWFLGGIASMEKDDSLAVKSFRKVTELASWNADGWVFLSSVYLTKNEFPKSVNILEAALKAVPDDFRVNFFLGVAYSRVGRNQDAARVLEKARQINPRDVEAIAQLALVYDGMKKTDESDSLYEEALRIDPADHLVLNNYGYSLAERGIQLERALAMAKKAVEAQPDNPSYLDTMGWILYRLGRYREAESFVKKAVSKGEVSAIVQEHLGDIYFKLNDTEQALEHWNEALKLDANNSGLREKISRKSL